MNIRHLFVLCFLTAIGCKQVYDPPSIQTNPDLLVVDGLINGNAGGTSTFQLSRTQKIGDSLGAYTPELHARLTILGSTGDAYPLSEKGNGIYSSIPLSLNHTEQYKLKIVTTNGSQYLSDTVSLLNCPQIDSLGWQQDDTTGNVHVNVSTHDPTGNSHYYRWTFGETWEYESELKSELQLIDGKVYFAIDSLSQAYLIWQCWRSDSSTDIVLANSTALSRDVINQAPLAAIPRGSQKISVRYSIYATQSVLTPSAYQYWRTMQDNTQNLGSLFDPQPAQLIGNFHCITNPREPVIGFLSASSTQQLRLFIDNSQLRNWDTVHTECNTIVIPFNPDNWQFYDYPDTLYGPYYFSGTSSLVLSKRTCLDCRLQGGSTQKPSFW